MHGSVSPSHWVDGAQATPTARMDAVACESPSFGWEVTSGRANGRANGTPHEAGFALSTHPPQCRESCRAPPSARHEEPRTGGRKRPVGDRPGRRSFSLRQEPNRKPPPDRPSPKGRQPSNTAAQRLPFPMDGTACRAEGGARQLPRHAAHNEREGEAEP